MMPELDQVPQGLRVTRTFGALEISARTGLGSAVFCFVIAAIFATGSLACLMSDSVNLLAVPTLAFVGCLFGYLGSREYANGFTLIVDAAGIRAKQQRTADARFTKTSEQVAIADITRLYAESGEIKLRHQRGFSKATPLRHPFIMVDHLTAELTDGRSVRLLWSIRNPSFTPFIVDAVKALLPGIKTT